MVLPFHLSSAEAIVIHVPAESPTIQSAIDLSSDGDTIIVADGVYSGEGNRNIDFKGKSIQVSSESGPENCVIDCQSQLGTRGFLFQSGETAESIVSGFSIIHGFVSDFPDNKGGAMRILFASPTILNCVISDNQAESGAGIYCEAGNPTIAHTVFSYNHTLGLGEGGAIACIGSSVIQDCMFLFNEARTGGAAMLFSGDTPGIHEVQHCEFRGNSASERGGAVACVYCPDSRITNCLFSSNSAPIGAAILSSHSNTHIEACEVMDNYGSGGSMFISQGGCLLSYGGSVQLTNCLIIGNSAYEGSCSYSIGTDLTIQNCTVSENVSPDTACIASINHSIAVRNCIVRNFTRDEVFFKDMRSHDISFNDIAGGFQGLSNFDRDPMYMDFGNRDYHLSPASPCIDAGTDRDAVPTDLSGDIRPMGGAIDIGAFESKSRPNSNRAYVYMPSHRIEPCDIVSCSVSFWNAESNSINGHPLFVILDLRGALYFAPSFDGVDWYEMDFQVGLTDIQIIPPFVWPYGAGHMNDAVWYAALVNPAMTEICSEIGVFDFDWRE